MANTNWENLPSTNTPINATNLNKISDGLVNVSNSVDSTYKTNVIETKNLFNIDNPILINGYVNYLTGVFSAQSASEQKCFIIKIKPNTSYTWSGYSTSSTLGYGLFTNIPNPDNQATSYGEITASKTITTGANDNYLAMFYSSTNATVDFSQLQIEEGSTATTYEPFTYNEVIVNNEKYTDTLNVGAFVDSSKRVNVLHSKNLFDKDIEQGAFNNNGVSTSATTRLRNSDFIAIQPNTTYTLSWVNANAPLGARIYYFTTNNYSTSAISDTGTFIRTPTSFTTPNNANYLKVMFANTNDGTATITTSDISNVMLNEGSTALPYEPYITPSIVVDNEEIYIKENPTNYISSVNLLTNKSLSSNDNQLYVNNSKFVSLNITLNITGAISSGSNLIILPVIARPKIANLSLMAKLKSGGNYYVINCWCRTDGTLAFQHTSNLANGDEVAIIGTYYALY